MAWCDTCETGMTVPQPTSAELQKLYAANRYRLATGERFNRVVESLIILFRYYKKNRIRKYIKKGRILDVGCGRGYFLRMMQDDGWQVEGLEADPTVAAELSAAYGVNIRAEDLLERCFPETYFDVITISHVLEHMQCPAEVIRECGRLLKSGGLLVVSVPNIDSLQAAAGRLAWFHLDLPNHLYHFSEKGLVKLLNNHAFSVARIKRTDLEYGPFGWLQTLLNLSGIGKNAFYQLLKNTELQKRTANKPQRKDIAISLMLLPVYIPIALFLYLLEVVIRKEGVFEIYAVKI